MAPPEDHPETKVPPVGEEIHLPDNTILPLLMAVGITVALVGVTTWIGFVIAGTVLFLWTLVRWIRDARHEMDELPPGH
jgi:biopolymer transport protein ExbB/TolQ